MVSRKLAHPSVQAYRKGCSCAECVACNAQTCANYRERRKANGGPLTKPPGIPTTITRLRREIGIVAEWKEGRWRNKLK